MKRTASIGSRVPPAVTSTLQAVEVAAGRGARARPRPRRAASGGSGSRPIPHSPGEPSAPVPGSSTVAPRARSVARLACVAGCSYIASFIAGATSSGRAAGERGAQ